MGSELDRPLGQNRAQRRKPGRRRSLVRRGVLGALAVIVVAGGSLYAALLPENIAQGNVTAADEAASSKAKAAGEVASASAGKSVDGNPEDKSQTGKPQSGLSGANVSRTMTPDGVNVTTISPAERSDSGPVVIEAGRQIGQDPHMSSRPDPQLVEASKYGDLPVVGSDGTRPMDVYARPASDSGAVRIAIVVGGLGLSQTGTLNAIDRLPADVTLAFAATGNSLQRWMQAARQAGHEILLQVPMEPFGYPGIDPGPHTLTVSGGKAGDLSDLHYAMGRITNYTGIMNYMGGRFMSDTDSITPVLRDVGKRGLLFLDDGSSPQSLAGKLATPLGVPYGKATLQLDGDVSEAAITTKLDDLEQVARGQGSAIGVASAFDVSVQAIAEWIDKAKSRGIVIVGVSQLVNDPGHNG